MFLKKEAVAFSPLQFLFYFMWSHHMPIETNIQLFVCVLYPSQSMFQFCFSFYSVFITISCLLLFKQNSFHCFMYTYYFIRWANENQMHFC